MVLFAVLLSGSVLQYENLAPSARTCHKLSNPDLSNSEYNSLAKQSLLKKRSQNQTYFQRTVQAVIFGQSMCTLNDTNFESYCFEILFGIDFFYIIEIKMYNCVFEVCGRYYFLTKW